MKPQIERAIRRLEATIFNCTINAVVASVCALYCYLDDRPKEYAWALAIVGIDILFMIDTYVTLRKLKQVKADA